MTRRDATLTGALALVLVTILPAYGRVLADDMWRGRVLAAGLLALAIAAGARAARANGVLTALASMLGLVLFTHVTALPDVGLLPDGSSWHAFRDLLASAGAELRETPAPAASSPAFTLAIATGTWVVMATAHEVLVRWRMPGPALVPPVVLWSLPLAIPMTEDGAVGRAVPFLAAAGLVLLLGTDDASAPDHAPRASASGLTVGAGALALAIAAPMLLPGYGGGALVDLRGRNDPRGYQPIVDISERLQLPDERDVLRVRSSERAYLRLAGLDSFDGSTWRLGPAGGGSFRPADSALFPATGDLPPEEPAVETTTVEVEVEVLDLANIYVPTPYQPTRVAGPFRDEMIWSTDGGFLATWNVADGDGGSGRVGVTQGVSYTVEAARPTPAADTLRGVTYDPAVLERWTQLPTDYPELAATAEQVYADAGAESVIDRALALQDWFVSDQRFTYDLDVPALRGADALRDFVLEDRTGYCEYFATAMAVMLRASGIPARVAVGFLPGEVTQAADPDAGQDLTEYTVSTSDAHAWVEVLFPGYGWVTFEPTPRSDQAQIVPTEDDLTPTETLRERRARELAEAAEDIEQTPQEPDDVDPEPAVPDEPTTDAPDTDGAGTDDPDAGLPGWVWPAAALLLTAVVVTGLRGRRRQAVATLAPAARVLDGQRRLLATARRHGIGRAPHESTADVARRWRREGRVDTSADRFAALATQAAFGGDVDQVVAEEADQLVAALEAELRASVGARDRVLAPIRVPAEAVRDGARRAGSGAVKAFRRD